VAPLSAEQVLQVLAGQRSVPDLPRLGPRMAWRMAYRSDALIRVLAEADPKSGLVPYMRTVKTALGTTVSTSSRSFV
jgi:hypothetical protein